MRTNKELLQVFLDNQKLFETGLCSWIDALLCVNLINNEEFKYLNDLILKHKPILYRLRISKNSIYGYYWEKGKIEPRIKWLKKHLK